MFDLTRKFRIESNEGDCHYASSFADAKYQAGVIRLNIQSSLRDPEWIIVTRQLGKPARWYATETLDGGEKLTAIFCEAVDVPAAHYQHNRANALAKLIDREDRRRQRKRGEQQRRQDDETQRHRREFGKGTARPVICVSTDPPRLFDAVRDAARWVGVKHPTMIHALKPGRNGRRRLCCKMEFAYADTCDSQIVAKATRGTHDDVQRGQSLPINR